MRKFLSSGKGIRTPDITDMSRSLYQLSYAAIIEKTKNANLTTLEKNTSLLRKFLSSGKGIRTPDITDMSRSLYQLSYAAICLNSQCLTRSLQYNVLLFWSISFINFFTFFAFFCFLLIKRAFFRHSGKDTHVPLILRFFKSLFSLLHEVPYCEYFLLLLNLYDTIASE